MTDTRPRAEQKAREKHTGSARQQAKEALREEISTFNGAGVKKIASAAESRAGDDNRRLRVVAYCRVSTDDLDQTISIELQKDEYRYKLQGARIDYNGETLYIFDLTSTEAFLPSVKDPETAKRRPSKPMYPEDWRDSFGMSVREHTR